MLFLSSKEFQSPIRSLLATDLLSYRASQLQCQPGAAQKGTSSPESSLAMQEKDLLLQRRMLGRLFSSFSKK